MVLENQRVESDSSSLRVILGNFLNGVANVFALSVKKNDKDLDEQIGQSVEHKPEQAADIITTVVQDKVGGAVSGAIGGSVLGSVASGVVGAMAGAVAGELVDTVMDSVSGVGSEKKDAADVPLGLGILIPFDDTSEIYAHVRNVLRHFEGNTASPCMPELGKSSATISTGLDLGQHDVASLQKMGITEDIIEILKPLLKKKAQEAKKFSKNIRCA